jgi:BetI-type transcriptional repressor, C-terminal
LGAFATARDADVATRRLLTMIDGLGAQMVVRAVPSAEAKHIARAYLASELGLAVLNRDRRTGIPANVRSLRNFGLF